MSEPEDWTPRERSSPFIARVAADAVARHERRLHAAPPHPIPPWLAPDADPPAAGEYLVMVATAEEWLAIASFIGTLDDMPEGANVRTVWRDGSPWLEIDLVLGREAHRVERFVLWRYTLAIHRLGDDGAVEDDPVWTPALYEGGSIDP
jgi:hypothetical protein